jgi:hypothetical protein
MKLTASAAVPVNAATEAPASSMNRHIDLLTNFAGVAESD